MDGKRWYPFEKLEVYQLAVRFHEIVKQILAKFPQIEKEDVSQLRRSGKSTIRNTCEGSGEFRPREKARFYRMAARSATESGGTLRIIEGDVGPDPLFDEAHEVNYLLHAKLLTLSKRKGS